jgi:uncharacterized membrane protein YraQ (UPF0718 family)
MAKKEKPPRGIKKETDMKENIGRVLVNTGQVIFATLFLGGVIRGEIPPYIMMTAGGIAALVFVFIGLLLTVKEKKEE